MNAIDNIRDSNQNINPAEHSTELQSTKGQGKQTGARDRTEDTDSGGRNYSIQESLGDQDTVFALVDALYIRQRERKLQREEHVNFQQVVVGQASPPLVSLPCITDGASAHTVPSDDASWTGSAMIGAPRENEEEEQRWEAGMASLVGKLQEAWIAHPSEVRVHFQSNLRVPVLPGKSKDIFCKTPIPVGIFLSKLETTCRFSLWHILASSTRLQCLRSSR